MALTETKIINRSTNSDSYYSKRTSAQKFLNFAQMQEVLQRNIKNTYNKSFTQYTKELLKTYINSPSANQDTLREVSRFVCRNSMIYQKLLMYYSSLPLYYYNVTQINDLTKVINATKALKNYQTVLEQFEKLHLKKECYTALYMSLRDGFYVGYNYISDNGIFFMPLDVQYCRIYGKTTEGEWIIYFNAAYFDAGNNKDYIYGINEDGVGVWDQAFIDGYEAYKKDGRDYQWFRLPPERTFALISGSEDEFAYPLPFFLPILKSLLDLLDLEDILMSKTELENYKLIVSKIPLIDGTEDVDDFAISLELANQFNQMLGLGIPELVGHVVTPMDIDTVEFESSNSTQDTDALATSIQNLFSNAGASQLVVSGGTSTNSVGLKHAIENDMATTWVWVDRIESWLNYFIKMNISEGYRLRIHHISWYNRDEYIKTLKDSATLGASALDYLTSLGDSPYMAYQKLTFENAIGIKNLMIPLQSSYNSGGTDDKSDNSNKKNEDDLSEEGIDTRDADKNGSES